MTKKDESAITGTYAKLLRESDELQILIEEATLQSPEALAFDPDAEETDEVTVEKTDQGTVVEIIDRVDVTDEKFDFTGFTRNTVTGYFDGDELQSVTLRHEFQHGPLAGGGTEFTYQDGEITTDIIWIS